MPPGEFTPPGDANRFFVSPGMARRAWSTDGESSNSTWRTNMSLSWNRRLSGWTSAQVFFRSVVTNVFNTLRLDGSTRRSSAGTAIRRSPRSTRSPRRPSRACTGRKGRATVSRPVRPATSLRAISTSPWGSTSTSPRRNKSVIAGVEAPARGAPPVFAIDGANWSDKRLVFTLG